jgi:hypothetical protein
MKKLLLILLCLPFMTLAQQNLTFVPDDSLEFYLEYNGMGNGIPYDDYVTTSNIYTVTSLNVSNRGIHNLRGIEDFYALTWLDCHNNDIIFPLDLSNNTFLTTLDCH